MYRLIRLRVLIALSAAIVASIGLLSAATAASPPSLFGLTGEDLDVLDIHDVTTSPADGAAPLGPGTIGATNAVVIAQKRVGRSDAPVQVVLASASRFEYEAERPVWLVLFDGGTAPGSGPWPGGKELRVTVTGVLVDQETGDVPRWFMH